MKKIVPVILFALMLKSASAITYYSRTNGGVWNQKTSWSTVTYGNATNTATFPKAGDVANIGDGYTIFLTSAGSCLALNIGQGTSGILEYGAATNYSLTVSGNLTVNSGAQLRYNTAITHTHTCYVAGNFTNDGTVSFYMGAGMVVNLILNGNSNTTISGAGTWTLNNVTMNKNTSTLNYVDVSTNAFESAIKLLTLTYGTFIHNNIGTFSVNPANNFIINANVIVRVPQGTMNFAANLNYLMLRGSLVISGGTVNIGTSTGIHGLYTDQNGTNTPSLTISSGTLNIQGGLTHYSTSAFEPFSFTMTGGAINLQLGTLGLNREVFKITDVAGSSFTMSGGTITLQKPNRFGTSVTDVVICGANGTVTTTGGSIVFGNASTPTGKIFSFQPFANATYPHMIVAGDPSALISLQPCSTSTADAKMLSLTINSNKTFDIQSTNGTGDNRKLSLLRNNGTDAFSNSGTFTARQSTVAFEGSTNEGIGGTTITDFYTLEVNNSMGVTLNSPCNATNYLLMTNGVLSTTNTNILTCTANADANLGNAASYVDGPMVHTVATASTISKTYPIGKATAWRPVVLTVQHSDNTSVTYRSEMFNSPASGLPFTLPPSLQKVSDIRYFKFIREFISNFVSGNIQIYYDVDDAVTDYASLSVVQDDGISQWVDLAGTATANGTGNIVSTSFNFFNNYFALGNPLGGHNVLPIALLDFNGNMQKNKVVLNWITSSEINNDYFEIERSADNIHFSSIAQVNGNGNTTLQHYYSATDAEPLSGVSYYRLKQFDFDGISKTFGPVTVNNSEQLFRVFPTITSGTVNIAYNGDLNNVRLYNVDGKEYPTTISKVSDGIWQISINSPGRFFLRTDHQKDFIADVLVIN